jgi:two-component system, chemotaxis family, protein-glutamate methylesterase/glutaminase
MPLRKIKVLVVDDSWVIRELLTHLLGGDPEIQVIGTAGNGEEALAALAREKPDVITMDIHMPKLDGLETTRRIMQTQPVPIVIVSASGNPDSVATTFEALDAGAVAVLEKPRGMGHPDHDEMARKLIQTVKLMSEVKVVRRWARSQAGKTAVPSGAAPAGDPPRAASRPRLVAIGASTGGPPVLQTILKALPGDFPVPLLVVQHIAAGFLEGMREWLSQTTGFPVHIAAHGEIPLPGHVYLAPDDAHMGVDRSGRIFLGREEPENGLRPSVGYLFRSLAGSIGAEAVGVLLTGMGKDGAPELKSLREKGAVTIAQDEKSSVVHGMPGEAIHLGAAAYVLPPEKIGAMLASLAAKGKAGTV